MSRWSDLKEFLSPGSVRHTVAPPLEAGLRPNRQLQDAEVIARFAPLEVEDISVWGSRLVASVGRRIVEIGRGGSLVELAAFDGESGALAVVPEGLVVAVEGVGIVVLGDGGSVHPFSTDARVAGGVTALCATPDGRLLVTIGSTNGAEWERALLRRDRTGLLLRIASDGTVEELDRGLAWPAGVAVEPEGSLLLSLSQDHRIERRSADGARRGATAVLSNLPGYPGRIVAASDGTWWAAMPWVRNRATELMFEFPAMVEELITTTEVDTWLVPRLHTEVPRRAPLQAGQLSTLGQIKPWAPPRTYGLAFRFTREGLILESAHSRTDGDRHGVTGVAVRGDRVAIAVRGSGYAVEIEQEADR